MTTSDAWILPIIPLGAFVLIALFHNFIWRKGDWIGLLAIFTVWLLVFAMLGNALSDYPVNLPGLHSYEWMTVGDYQLRIGIYVDQITLVMLIVVTTVALMVNFYSLGYMKGEARYGWFYAVLALFAFSMLGLVLADNLLVLFSAWELVGVCSYFLIGFYFERRSAVEAAKKAFVTNRIGDVGLLVGIILFWRATGTFNIQQIIGIVEEGGIARTTLIVATFSMLLGPIAKSAQVPLHVWLPDAMEGPTPVSALIHAATMVVAGVYLVARMLPVIEATPYAQQTVLVLGTITALFGAIVALVQSDLKKVVAYSTISNLGFMMMALGAGALTAAMFHLMTHAFFKACLFLGAGSIIHSTGHQEMNRLGGLRKYMPLTFWTFLIAALANAGIPPLAGFWSKDEVLHGIYDQTNITFFILAIVWVVLSGAYTARMLYYTFWGEYKGLEPVTAAEGADIAAQAVHHSDTAPPVTAAAATGATADIQAARTAPGTETPGQEETRATTATMSAGHTSGGTATLVHEDTHSSAAHDSGDGFVLTPGGHGGGHGDDAHGAGHGGGHGGHGGGLPHESPFTMAAPLVFLAALAILSGLVTLPGVGRALGFPGGIGEWVFPSVEGPESFHFTLWLAALGTGAALAGILLGLYMLVKPGRIQRFTAAMPELYSIAAHKFYFDELYQTIIDRVFLGIARFIAVFDRKVVNDTGVDGPPNLARYIGYRLKFTQSGRLPNYALMIVLGIVVLAVLAYTTRV